MRNKRETPVVAAVSKKDPHANTKFRAVLAAGAKIVWLNFSGD
jgi:hypothetical protein